MAYVATMVAMRFRLSWRCLGFAVAGTLACSDGSGPKPGTLRVRLYYVGGRSGADLRVTARAGPSVVSARVGSTDEVALRPALNANTTVEIRVDEQSATPRRFHPAIAIVDKSELGETQRFVLIPRRWTIASSSSSCRDLRETVDIDLDLAYTRSVADPSSFYPRTPNASGGWTYATPYYPQGALPVPVAFDRERTTDPITRDDSVAFWLFVRILERELCDDLFQATMMSGVTADRGVTVLIDRSLGVSARTELLTGTNEGATVLTGGRVTCRFPNCFVSGAIVTHELLHLLGFGHTCAWSSVMKAGCEGDSDLSPADIAYVQVYNGARSMQLATKSQHSLGSAHQGQRVIMRGLPFEPVN